MKRVLLAALVAAGCLCACRGWTAAGSGELPVEEADRLEGVVNGLLTRARARTAMEIAADCGSLQEVLAGERTGSFDEGYLNRLTYFLDMLEYAASEQAVRLGLDWQYYNARISSVPDPRAAAEMDVRLGRVLLKNQELLRALLQDPRQLARESLMRAVDKGIGALAESPDLPDLHRLKREMKDWPMTRGEYKTLETILVRWIKALSQSEGARGR